MSPQPGCYSTVAVQDSDRPCGSLACPACAGTDGGDPLSGWPPVELPRLPWLPAASRSLHPGQETPMLSPAVRFPCLVSHQIPAGRQDMSAGALLAWVIAASVF